MIVLDKIKITGRKRQLGEKRVKGWLLFLVLHVCVGQY